MGRPAVPANIRTLIRTMTQANPRWGAPRIHGELSKLGIDVCQATVAKYMGRRRQPPSQTWRTFLRNHIGQIVAADFFVVPTVTYRLLLVLVLLAHERRHIRHIAVTAHPTAAWAAHQLREAFPWDEAPRYLLHDRDHAFDRLGALAIEEVESSNGDLRDPRRILRLRPQLMDRRQASGRDRLIAPYTVGDGPNALILAARQRTLLAVPWFLHGSFDRCNQSAEDTVDRAAGAPRERASRRS
jgi:hypothetical protein